MAAVICDLDGVVWLSRQAIPGSPDAVARLRAAGWQVLFVTNNSYSPVGEVEAALAAIGVPAGGDVLTSAQAAARLVVPGDRVLVAGGPGIREELRAIGADAVDDGPVDAVMVGFHRDFDFEVLRRVSTAVRAGARLIGTNDDATYPTPDGPIPGGGAILAAASVASGVEPLVAGKPHEPMADLVRSRVAGDIAASVVVGDRPSTDGLLARRLGCRYALVLSGVTRDPHHAVPEPDLVAPDLAGIAELLLGST